MATTATTVVEVYSVSGEEYSFTFLGTLASEEVIARVDDIFADFYHDLGVEVSGLGFSHSHS